MIVLIVLGESIVAVVYEFTSLDEVPNKGESTMSFLHILAYSPIFLGFFASPSPASPLFYVCLAYGVSFLGLMITFCLKWLYFDIEGTN